LHFLIGGEKRICIEVDKEDKGAAAVGVGKRRIENQKKKKRKKPRYKVNAFAKQDWGGEKKRSRQEKLENGFK